jgi:hypothetical protein
VLPGVGCKEIPGPKNVFQTDRMLHTADYGMECRLVCAPCPQRQGKAGSGLSGGQAFASVQSGMYSKEWSTIKLRVLKVFSETYFAHAL